MKPEHLPDRDVLRQRTQAIAMIEAIVCPEWESRFFSFDDHWSPGEAMASMRNGCGDDWFILFHAHGVAIKGLAHETDIARDDSFALEVQRQVPPAFASFLSEPAFSMNRVSFCFWRGISDSAWHKVTHPDAVLAASEDGAAEFLSLLIEPAESYQEFAEDYYEQDVPLSVVQSLYAHEPLTKTQVSALNAGLSWDDAVASAQEIGYPMGGPS